MNFKDTIIKNLFVLMLVFVSGYSGLILINLYFTNAVENLDQKIKNEHSKYKIGEYILKEISNIESEYYKMSLLSKKSSLYTIEKEILEELDDIQKAIDIIENGGVLELYIKIDIDGLKQVSEKIHFVPNQILDNEYKAIHLIPKIMAVKQKIYDIEEIIDLRNELMLSSSILEKQSIRYKMQRHLEQIPPIFVQMKEVSNNLLYQSRLSSEKLENEISLKKDFYDRLKAILTLLVISLVIFLGYIISKQIQRKSEALKQVTQEAKESAFEALNANKVKSQFLANMSHEIRTPLNAIIGFSEILAEAKLENKQAEQTNIILKSAKSLLNIINDILDISKVESGKFEITKEIFKTRKFFEQIVELFSINAKQKDIRFLYNYDINIPEILRGDTIRLKQVLSNLLSNAIKFTKNDAHVIFSINILKQNKKNIQLSFSIKDEGIGISKEQQEKIFLPFSQADTSISRKYGGTGLGLAISSKIINLMGSEIKVTSKEGKGSDFYFDLEFELPNEKIETKKKLGYNFLVTSISKDTENIRTNLVNYLSELGTVLKIDKSNEEIIDKKIDLIFYFGEKELFKKIKEIKNRDEIKVVYVGNKIKIIDNKDISDLIDFYIDIPLYGSKIFNVISTACNIDKKELENEKIDAKFDAKVLVAEDNLNNQKLIEILLQRVGIKCDIASNGKEAIELFKKDYYDLIFMDINMPIMDGLSALKEIRKFENNIEKKVPIVALTANTIKGDKEKYIKAGMNNYLSKPIETNELITILNKYLKTSIKEKEPSKIEKKKQNILVYKKEDTLKQLALDEIIVDKLLNNFLSMLDNDLEKIKKAIENRDTKEIYQASHYLKGPSANFAMNGAVQILEEFEQKAKENKDTLYNFEALIKYFDNVKKELK